ncbi:hypothetical protein MMYC01_202637 [Madurella mycetomatis]|uniref:Uncharacterized protein n=1 Tax=Madurella mycetomatis TaxID=100816 RepID=A0A175WD52_9PEZI|nr:hypothetical protein MMYC01_202637 [Madurella mycetomatis]
MDPPSRGFRVIAVSRSLFASSIIPQQPTDKPAVSLSMAVLSLCSLVAAAAAASWFPAVSAQLEREHPNAWGGAIQTPAPKPEADIILAPALTARPVARNVLQKRDTNTCGYVNGDSGFGYVCAADDAVCLYNDEASAVGCCLPTGCNIYTACLDYVSSDATSTLNMDRTRYCSNSAYPSCAALAYADAAWSGYTIPTCDSVATTYLFYMTTAGGSDGGDGFLDDITSEVPSSPPVPTTSEATTSVDGDSNSPATESPDLDQGAVAQEESAPVGAIVGGVVGGVAVLALIALGAFLLIRKKNQSQPSPPMPPVNPAYPNQMPPPSMAGMQGGGFAPADPHYSMIKPPMGTSINPMQPPASPMTFQSASPPPIYQSAMPPMQQQMPAPVPQGPAYNAYQPPPNNATELSTQRGDGQLHEMS